MDEYVWLTLVGGFIAGFFGQRSRMCFVGGFRDMILIRDSRLFKGFIGFVIAATVGYAWFHNGSPLPWMWENAQGGWDVSMPGGPWSNADGHAFPYGAAAVFLAVVGGIGIGFFSTLAGGCPFRQSVMAGEGSTRSWIYYAGFMIGAIVFHKYIADELIELFDSLGWL